MRPPSRHRGSSNTSCLRSPGAMMTSSNESGRTDFPEVEPLPERPMAVLDSPPGTAAAGQAVSSASERSLRPAEAVARRSRILRRDPFPRSSQGRRSAGCLLLVLLVLLASPAIAQPPPPLPQPGGGADDQIPADDQPADEAPADAAATGDAAGDEPEVRRLYVPTARLDAVLRG